MILKDKIAVGDVGGVVFVACPEVGRVDEELFGGCDILPEGVERADIKEATGTVRKARRQHARGNIRQGAHEAAWVHGVNLDGFKERRKQGGIYLEGFVAFSYMKISLDFWDGVGYVLFIIVINVKIFEAPQGVFCVGGRIEDGKN